MADVAAQDGHDSRYCGAKKHQGAGFCRRPAGWGTDHPGVGRCKLHGGKTQTHMVAAQKAILRAEANRLGIPVDIDAGEAMVQLVREAAGNVEFYRVLIAALPIEPEADELTWDDDDRPHYKAGAPGIFGRTYHVSGIPTGEAKPHVLIQLYNEERDRLKDYTVAALRAGVDERRVRLEEREVRELMAGAAAAIQAAKLTPTQAEQFRRAFAEHLRKAEGVDSADLAGRFAGPGQRRAALDAPAQAGGRQRARRSG